MRYGAVRTTTALVAAVILTASTAGTALAADKDVVVVNTSAEPVPTTVQGTVSVNDADHPALQPFADLKAISLADGQAQGDTQFDPVPTGKRLVIETVTLRAQAEAGQVWDVTMFVRTSGITVAHFLEVSTFETLGNIDIRTATLPVRFYADAGSQVSVHAQRQFGTTGLAGVTVSISGHRISIP